MKFSQDAPVLIVGAGPVGLTLAMDLAWRGIAVIVAETRARGTPPSPKCNHVAARSMEIFRRLGLAGKLRNAGLPPDYANDISYRTSFTGRELTRIPIPCRRDRYDATRAPIPVGRRRNRRTGLIRSSWNRSCLIMPPSKPTSQF